ncbi:hypothetical protein BDN70DRAFT_800234 [Pholiota conissans]|uniref:Mucoidy inhibitor A n=1 Tax=Pholiota conissans TaxID=109636 RepID=A0A9P5ZB03_9AGAR|nr:hypothetical protein BDN70DRAFT_800234 [Pholiota conissans]
MTLNLISILASEHPIKSVTITRSSEAEVVRTFALDLKKGQNKVEIQGLPSAIESTRPSGLDSARLDDFVYILQRTRPRSWGDVVIDSTPDSSSSESIRLLSGKLAALEKEKSAREQESWLLQQYANTLKGDHVAPADMMAFLDKYMKHTTMNIHTVTEIDEKIADLKRQIEDEQLKATWKSGEAYGKVVALISSDADASITFTLAYMVSNCEWTPKYELHTTTQNGKPYSAVSLNYLATIWQSTGEDWTHATITLSMTTNNFTPKGVPYSFPLKIFVEPPQRSKLLSRKRPPPPLNCALPAPSKGGTSSSTASTHSTPKQEVSPASRTLVAHNFESLLQLPSDPYDTGIVSTDVHLPPEGDANANVDASFAASVVPSTPLSMYFPVTGTPSIPSDGLQYRVTLAVLPLESEISYITIPRDDPTVFLQCEVKNTSEYRLISGLMDVIVDGSFINSTLIRNDINIGDTFECILGNDISTKVTYSCSCNTVRPEASTFSEGTVIATYTTKITVQNKHQYDIPDLVVRDCMPTSKDQRIRVILRRPLELGDAKQGDFMSLKKGGLKVGWEKTYNGRGGEKEGMFEWRWSVKSGATVELVAEYDVKGPKDIAWVIQPSQLSAGD